MLRPFFDAAMCAPPRQLSFRRLAGVHVGLVGCLAAAAAHAQTPPLLAAVGQLALILGIIEGSALIGWRLTQLPKSQALEFLLVSPVQPRRVFVAEALVGIARFALVCLAGVPVWLAAVGAGGLDPADLWVVLLLPFLWGTVAGLGLTVWAYESAPVRRWGERVALAGVIVYLVVGLLAGEKLRLWLRHLPEPVAEAIFRAVTAFHVGNPFGVVRHWFVWPDGPQAVWPDYVRVVVAAGLLVALFAVRAAFRFVPHFRERHYRPLAPDRVDQSDRIGDRPLTWWAVRRVTEYSGSVNVWLAVGFCMLYSAFLIAGDQWPAWMGRLPFLIFESWGGAPTVAAGLCVIATVPAVFQYGLWDATVTDRCRRLELLLLTELTGPDYWLASLAAAWKRGQIYLVAAAMLWVALAVSGRAAWQDVAAAALGGLTLWGFSFAVGFRAFCTGNQASGLASVMIFGLPLMLFALLRAGQIGAAAAVPTALCYLPVRYGVTPAWGVSMAVYAVLTGWLTYVGLSRCIDDLRRWYDANHGRKTG